MEITRVSLIEKTKYDLMREEELSKNTFMKKNYNIISYHLLMKY